MLALWSGLTNIIWNMFNLDDETSIETKEGEAQTDLEAGVSNNNTDSTSDGIQESPPYNSMSYATSGPKLDFSSVINESNTSDTNTSKFTTSINTTNTTPTKTATLFIRMVELQFYRGPTEGEILGASSAEAVSTIASATGSKRDPVQLACSHISMAAAKNQQNLMKFPSLRNSRNKSNGNIKGRNKPLNPFGWRLWYDNTQLPSTSGHAIVRGDGTCDWSSSKWMTIHQCANGTYDDIFLRVYKEAPGELNETTPVSIGSIDVRQAIGDLFQQPQQWQQRGLPFVSDVWLLLDSPENYHHILVRVQVCVSNENQLNQQQQQPLSVVEQNMLFEDTMNKIAPKHDHHGMPLELCQRRNFSVLDSYEARLEEIRRKIWAYVHPSNFFRDLNGHGPFSITLLASKHEASVRKSSSSNSMSSSDIDSNHADSSANIGGMYCDKTEKVSNNVVTSESGEQLTPSKRVQNLIWESGIPSDRRRAVFMLLSGAAAHSRHHGTEFYRLMVQQSEKPGGVHRVDSEQIDVDIPRTYSRRASATNTPKTTLNTPPPTTTNKGRIMSTSTKKFVPTLPLEPSLRRVLRAFATSHRAVGYCQGMNFIAARFLMINEGNEEQSQRNEETKQMEIYKEEQAYWLLVAVCTKLCPGYYVPSMTGTLADIRVVQDLLHARMPAVASKVRRLGVPLEGIISNWLLTLYCSGGKNGIPFHVSTRILDVLMLEGCNALVAVAYAIFELAKPKLLTATSVHEFIDVLTHQLKHMTSASPLLRAARRILVSIGPKQLNEARRMVTIDVASDAEDMMKRKLHRKFNYFDDVAFGEAYAHFCTACIQDSNADRFSVLQNNSQQNNYMNKAEGTYIGTIISHSNSNPHSLRPSRRQHDADDMYIDYRALDLPSFRKLMIELASFSILWSKDLVGLDRLFVAFDADHNGFVDVHEFMQGIQAMSQVGTKEEKLRLLFMSHDARGTGLLGAKDISCILKTMYKLLDYPKVGRRARDAAAKAIVNILSTQDHSDNNETCICFDEFLALPDVQPDVLKIMNFHIPFASKRSAKKCAKRATEAAKAVASANAAELTLRQTKRKSPLKRKSSVDVVQQLKTSPRGPG